MEQNKTSLPPIRLRLSWDNELKACQMQMHHKDKTRRESDVKLSSKVPAVVQASALYHLRMKVAFDAKRQGTSDHPVVRYFLSATDAKLGQVRRKLGLVG